MSDTIARKPGRPKGSKNKTQVLQQITGKDESSPKAAPTTLEQIWGDDGTAKYSNLNAEQYERHINGMSRADLFHESSKRIIPPTDNLVVLKKKLMTEFFKHSVKYKPLSSAPTSVSRKSAPRPQKLTVQQILDGEE